jgi:hypothetical protein
VTALGARSWEATPSGVQRLAEELPSPHGTRLLDGARPGVEMLAAQSSPLSEMSDAAGEVAGWALEERFAQARTTLCSAYGDPRESETPAAATSGPRSVAGRTATWTTPKGRLTLEQRCTDRHQLTLRVEPGAAVA